MYAFTKIYYLLLDFDAEGERIKMKIATFKKGFRFVKKILDKDYMFLFEKKERNLQEDIFQIKSREEVWEENNTHSKELLEVIDAAIPSKHLFTVYLFVLENHDISHCLIALKEQTYYIKHINIIFSDSIPVSHINSFCNTENISASCYNFSQFKKHARTITNWTNSIFMDSHIILENEALLRCAYILKTEKFNLCYSDSKFEKKLMFKPDWSEQLLLSTNYIGNFFIIGSYDHWDEKYLDCSDSEAILYHLALNFTKENTNVYHLQQILFSEEINRNSATQSYKRVLRNFINRLSLKVKIEENSLLNANIYPVFDLVFPDDGPMVTIILQTGNGYNSFLRCAESLKKTSYKNYKVLVVQEAFEDEEIIKYVNKRKLEHITIPNNREMNSYASINNIAAMTCDTDYLLFLSDNMEIKNEKWLSNMMGYQKMENVGVVGAKIVLPNQKIYGTGVIIGDGIVKPVFQGMPEVEAGYMCYAKTTRNYSAVMPGCVLISKDTFVKVGMFDAISFPKTYGEIDLCMRILLEQNKNIVCVSNSILICHKENQNGYMHDLDEAWIFKEKYKNYVDCYYNLNLSLENAKFEINVDNSFDYSKVPSRKQKIVVITHNLNYEGAPLQIIEIVQGLRKNNNFEFEIWSPKSGPLSEGILAEYGIKTKIVPFGDEKELPMSKKEYYIAFKKYIRLLKKEKVDCLIANTLHSFYGIDYASYLKIPSIWLIHESVDYNSYFNSLDIEVQKRFFKCFSLATKLMFVAKATQAIYKNADTNHSALTIHNSIILDDYNCYKKAVSKNEARRRLGISKNKKVAVMVGTICKRKGQLDILKSLKIMRDKQKLDDFIVYIVGGRESDYLNKMYYYIEKNGLKDYVNIVMETRDVNLYYRASDLFVFTSYNESYPRVILEAMAFDLPIITTPVYGIAEQVFEGINGRLFEPGNTEKLAELIIEFLTDNKKYVSYAKKSNMVLKFINNYDDMIKDYNDILEHMKYVNYRK